jgi:hypothetical protein
MTFVCDHNRSCDAVDGAAFQSISSHITSEMDVVAKRSDISD